MKKNTIITIVIVASVLLLLLLWKSGVFNKKKTASEMTDEEGENSDNIFSELDPDNAEAERAEESFEDLSEDRNNGLLNSNKKYR